MNCGKMSELFWTFWTKILNIMNCKFLNLRCRMGLMESWQTPLFESSVRSVLYYFWFLVFGSSLLGLGLTGTIGSKTWSNWVVRYLSLIDLESGLTTFILRCNQPLAISVRDVMISVRANLIYKNLDYWVLCKW